MEVRHHQRSHFIKEYVDSNEFITDLMAEILPIFPVICFVSMNRNVVLRLLIGGQCIGCKYVNLHKVYKFQFVLNLAHPFLTKQIIFLQELKEFLNMMMNFGEL